MGGKGRHSKVVIETKTFWRVFSHLLPSMLLVRGMRSRDDAACPSGVRDDDEYDENKSFLSRQHARKATSYLQVEDNSSGIMSDEAVRIPGISLYIDGRYVSV